MSSSGGVPSNFQGVPEWAQGLVEQYDSDGDSYPVHLSDSRWRMREEWIRREVRPRRLFQSPLPVRRTAMRIRRPTPAFRPIDGRPLPPYYQYRNAVIAAERRGLPSPLEMVRSPPPALEPGTPPPALEPGTPPTQVISEPIEVIDLTYSPEVSAAVAAAAAAAVEREVLPRRLPAPMFNSYVPPPEPRQSAFPQMMTALEFMRQMRGDNWKAPLPAWARED